MIYILHFKPITCSGNVNSQFATAVSSGSNSSFGSAVPGSAFSPIKPAAVTNGTPGSKALPRARLPPPSKIPASAVEMPGDSLANLDVQFGGLDLQFGAAGSDSGSMGGGGFDFGGGNAINSAVSSAAKNIAVSGAGLVVGGSSGKADLESKFSSIPAPTGADKSMESSTGYKSLQQQPSVKEVNQSLTSALSAAGIKPSGSSDPNLVGYGGQRSDKSSSSSSYPQRSPGPQQQQQVLDHRSKQADSLGSAGGYPGNSYSYQPSGGAKSASQYGGSSNYQTTGGYERQASSGYSSTNGLGSAASSAYGGNVSGYNSATPGSGSNYSANSGYNSSSYNAASSSSSSNYSPYNNNGSSNSYSSSKANNASGYSSASQQQQQQFSTSDTTTTTTSSAAGKFDGTSVSNSNNTTSNNSGYPVSSSGSYGLGSSSANSRGSGGGVAAASAGSNKMLPNLPPGVANVIPQYMIGAGAGAGGKHF